MNLSAPFIKRPVMTILAMLALVVAGTLAFITLPVSDLPTIEHPRIQVTAGYTGANAETVLNQLTIPLEKELVHVKGVKELSSVSSSGSSTISLKFALDQDMNQAIRDVQSALNRADGKLPSEVDPRPTFHQKDDAQDPILYMMLTSDQADKEELITYNESYILPRLNRISGVAQVLTYGNHRGIWLKLNPELMAARHIGFDQVMDAIRQHTEQMPLGSITTGSKSLSIELAGAVKNAKEIENLKIGNSSVRIRDIGTVSDHPEEEQQFHFVTKEKTVPALILAIQKVNDGNTVAISQAVQEALGILKKELPPHIHVDIWLDKAVWIQESIHDVEWSLLIAFGLVIAVIFLSLGRLLEAVIVSAAMPFSLLGTFILMHFLHYSLDLLSLLALTLSVGFIVDDAIVVLENIVRHQEGGEAPRKASLKGSKEIGFTILSMTISLVAVFIPLLFMDGTNGQLFREFSVTLAVAILVSGVISLTLTPMLCSRLLVKHKSTPSKLQLGVNAANTWLIALYQRTLAWTFRYSKTVLTLSIMSLFVGFILVRTLAVELLPPEDRGFLFAAVNLPSNLTHAESEQFQNKIESMFKNENEIENFLTVMDTGQLFFVVRLLPHELRGPQNAVIGRLQKQLDAIPGIRAFLQGYQLINLDIQFGNAGQYKLYVRGLDQKAVDDATQKLAKAMQEHPAVSFAQHSLKNDSPKLVLHFNDALAHKLGISKRHIQSVMQQAYGQGTVGSIHRNGVKENIYLDLESTFKNRASALNKLFITGKDGDLIPVKALLSWEEKLEAPNLRRREQLPAALIRFSMPDTLKPNEGLEQIEELMSQVLPAQVSGVFDGQALEVSTTISRTAWLLLAAAVVMYVVLGILYESFIHPLIILSSLPFAALGGILTLYLFDEPISLFSAVGFLLLIGIVKKNGIMMVDYALEVQKRGVEARQAIFEACMVRFRPIMMTTFTAVMGALPIAIGFGDGSEMRRGLGLVIVGGLLFSQLLTLYVTPLLASVLRSRASQPVAGEDDEMEPLTTSSHS